MTEELVQKQLSNQDVKKSAGLDGIQAYFLGKASTTIAPSLTAILNKFIRPWSFPSSWKCAKVPLLHKGDPLDDPGKFCPIIVFPVI